jgi:hypothetical protein
VGQRAEQDHQDDKDVVEWNLEKQNRSSCAQGNQAAGDHDECMFFRHLFLLLS